MYISGSYEVYIIYIMFCISCLMSYYGINHTYNRRSYNYISFFFSFVAIVCFIFSRKGLGIDEPTYLSGYLSVLNNDYTKLFSDIGFNYLNYTLSFIGINIYSYNNVVPLLYVLIIGTMILFGVNKKYISTVFVFFIFTGTNIDFMFNAYRQAYSFAFFTLGILIDRGKSRYNFIVILIFFISFLFHWSAIVAISIYYLSQLISDKNIFKMTLPILIFANVSVFINFEWLSIISDIISFIGFDNEKMIRVIAYTNDKATTGKLYDLNYFGRLLLMIPVFFISILIYFSVLYDVRTKLVKYSVLYILFCTFFIGMSFSFRNYYWIFPFVSLLSYDILKENKKVIVIYCILFLNSTVTFFTSPLMFSLFK